MKRYIFLFILIIALNGCSFAPKYVTPEVPTPSSYKEAGRWIQIHPKTIVFNSEWWKMYHDPLLNNLSQKLTECNQDLKAAVARYDQAKAAVTIARSELFPTISAPFNANREQTSKTIANSLKNSLFSDIAVGVNLTYEVDLWGRIRNNIAAAKGRLRASAADIAAIDLSSHAELATDYFSLRGLDKTQDILDKRVRAYERALVLVKHRHKGGASPVSDVYEAQTQLENAKTAAADNHMKRNQLEHAIAILIGEAPAFFSLPVKKNWQIPSITVAPNLPSTLLIRRPDVVRAEELVEAANAEIGVARAAYFPQVNLAGGFGFESAGFSRLLTLPSQVWSLGPISNLRGIDFSTTPLVNQTVFAGGRLIATTRLAKARYAETAANYRQTVLNAFRDVEDSLIALRQLDREYRSQRLATEAANNDLNQAYYRYKGGIITYLDVVIIENIALQADIQSVNIRTLRNISSVSLIKALGGGWQR